MKKTIYFLIVFSLLLTSKISFANCDLTQIADLERKKDGAVRLFARTGTFEKNILDNVFGISRIKVRELSLAGSLPGIIKASW